MTGPAPSVGQPPGQSSDKTSKGAADPPRSLPTGPVLLALLGEMVVLGLVAWLAAPRFGWSGEETTGVIVGAATASFAVLAAFVGMLPWKSRPAADWTLFWLGSATVRLLVTPLALFSVYFATLLPGVAVLLGGAAMFFIALVTETVIIARAVLQPAARSGSSTS